MTAYSTKRLADQIRAYLRERVDSSAGEQTIVAALRQSGKVNPGDITAALREMRQRDELYFDGPPERRRYKLPPEPERLPDETPRAAGEPEYTPPVDPPVAEGAPRKLPQRGFAGRVPSKTCARCGETFLKNNWRAHSERCYGVAVPWDWNEQEPPVTTTPTTTATPAPGADDLALQVAEFARGLLADALRERDGRIKLMQAEVNGQSELNRQVNENLDRALKAEARVAELERALAATGDALTKAEDDRNAVRGELDELRGTLRKLMGVA